MTITCESLSDKLPLVVHGRAEWTAEEARHLEGCAGCAAEWRLVSATARLGQGAAAGFDAGAATRGVLARVAGTRRAARWKRAGWLTGLAAAAALVLVLRSGAGPEGGTPPGGGEVGRLQLAELDGLEAETLERILDGLEAPVGKERGMDVPSLGELDDDQLERVLRSLEG